MNYGESVAVVAVTTAGADTLPGFLDSLRSATLEPLDIVVAHHGDRDPAIDELATRGGVRLIEAGPVGYGRTANLGVRDTTAEFVVVADSDVIWSPGSLDELLAATHRWPSGAAFGPLIRTELGVVLPSARAIPSLRNGIGHALFGRWWRSNPWTAAYRQGRRQPAERTTGWLADTCVLLRRDAFDAIGGFDVDQLVYLEDLDLGDRLAKAGWHNVYVPSAVVTGASRQRATADRAQVAVDRHRSVWRYLARRYAGWRWFPVRVLLRSGLSVRATLAKRARRRPPRASRPPGAGIP